MDTRHHLLQAASDVVAAQGSRALTLEAVARQAGVSKGGLLYHFPNKNALIAGMVAAAVEAFEHAVAAGEESGDDWLAAYVDATLADLTTHDPLSGVFTAIAEEPELLAPFRAALDRWYHRAAHDYGPDAVPLLLALDGLWLHARLGTLPNLDLDAVGERLRHHARAARRR